MSTSHPGWERCPGSGNPPYRYIKGKERSVVNSSTGRVIYARAICELCNGEHSVNVKGVLRSHHRLRRTNPA